MTFSDKTISDVNHMAYRMAGATDPIDFLKAAIAYGLGASQALELATHLEKEADWGTYSDVMKDWQGFRPRDKDRFVALTPKERQAEIDNICKAFDDLPEFDPDLRQL